MDCSENRNARAPFGIGRLAAVQCPGAQTDDSQPRQSCGDRHLPHANQDFPSPVVPAHPPACRVPNQCPIENANCGKVGAVREEITVSMWPIGNTLLITVFGKRNFQGGPAGALGGPADAPGPCFTQQATGPAQCSRRRRPLGKERGRPPRIRKSWPTSATRTRGRETSVAQRDRQRGRLEVRNGLPFRDIGLDYDAT